MPLSSLYAPTTRLTLLGLVSLLKASTNPKMASGGPCSTPLHTLADLQSACLESVQINLHAYTGVLHQTIECIRIIPSRFSPGDIGHPEERAEGSSCHGCHRVHHSRVGSVAELVGDRTLCVCKPRAEHTCADIHEGIPHRNAQPARRPNMNSR